ncbi:MAG: hypothetical protein V2A73_19775 [Pseudomonadota bacterium]
MVSLIAKTIRAATETLLWPVDQLPAQASLTVLAVVTGVAMLWVVGKVTPQRALEKSRDRMTSAVYEVRLFLDSPRRMFAALGRLLCWSARYLVCLLPALLVLLPPLAILYPCLEIRYGLAPLPLSEPLNVRVTLAPGVDGSVLRAETAGAGMRITAPPLFVEDERVVYVRVVLSRPGRHDLLLSIGDRTIAKLLSAASSDKASPERRAGLASAFALGSEEPLPANAGMEVVAVRHPASLQRWLGMSVPWWLYWLGLATFVAFLLRRPMRVTI